LAVANDSDIKNSGKTQQKQTDAQETRGIILSTAVSLFSEMGFNGVSMRVLAKAVKITPAALYYYFPTKKDLHKAAVLYSYKDRDVPAVAMLAVNDAEQNPLLILEKFILRLSERFYRDEEFMRLVQWTLLDAEHDENIRNVIVEVVYQSHFSSLQKFLEHLAPKKDCYMLATFIFGMVMQNYFTLPIRKHLAGHQMEKEDPKEVTSRIMQLLKNGMSGKT
jgi:AcrR family transcriptional regulator